jgi:hypothetical protein
MNIWRKGLPRLPLRRHGSTQGAPSTTSSSTRFGTRGFLDYLDIDMCSTRGASSSTSTTSTLIWSTSTFVFVFGIYSTTSTGLWLTRLRRLPRRHRLSTSSSVSTARRRQDFGSWGFIVYLVDIDFQLRLRCLPHRRRLGYGSRGFIVYLTVVDSDFTFINTYFVACSVRHQGLHHNHRIRGAMVAL